MWEATELTKKIPHKERLRSRRAAVSIRKKAETSTPITVSGRSFKSMKRGLHRQFTKRERSGLRIMSKGGKGHPIKPLLKASKKQIRMHPRDNGMEGPSWAKLVLRKKET